MYIPGGLKKGMGMYFMATFVEMIKAHFLKGHHFLGFNIIKRLKNVISGNPPNVIKMNYQIFRITIG